MVCIKVPYLSRGTSFARSSMQVLHGLSRPCIQTLVGQLMDQPSLLGMDPLLTLVMTLTVDHFDGLPTHACRHVGLLNDSAGVIPPELVIPTEGEELRRGYVLVAGIHPQGVGVFIVMLQGVNTQPARFVPQPSVGKHMLWTVQDELLRVDVVQIPFEILTLMLLLEMEPVSHVAHVHP